MLLALSNTAKTVVTLAVGPAMGTLSDVHGRRFFWTGAQVGVQLGYIAILLHVCGYLSIWPFLVLNSLGGLLLPAFLTVITDEYEREQRASAFGLLIATFDCAVAFVPFLAKSLSLQNGVAVVCATGAIGLALCIIYGETLRPDQRLGLEAANSVRWRPDAALSILRSSSLFRRLSVIILASTLAMAGSQQCFIMFLEASYGFDRVVASSFILVLALGGLAVQMIGLPLLMSRVTITKVLALGLGLQLMQNIILVLVHAESAVLISCVLGGFGTMTFPCVAALKSCAAPEHEQGRVQGAVSSLQSAAMGAGPMVYGAVFAYLVGPSVPGGHPMPGATFGLSVVALAVAVVMTMTLHHHVPEELKHPPPSAPRRRRSMWSLRRRLSSGGDPMTSEMTSAACSSGS